MNAQAISLATRRRQNAVDTFRSEMLRARQMMCDAIDVAVAAVEQYEAGLVDRSPFDRAPAAEPERLLTAAQASTEVFGGAISAKSLTAGAHSGRYPCRRLPSATGSRPRIMFDRGELLRATQSPAQR